MGKPLIVNIAGGPCVGKSTIAAGVFYKLKINDFNCELITEYAKTKVYEENYLTLENQLYIFAKQYHDIFTIKNKVDIIVTDSPLILFLYYGQHMSDNFKGLVKEIVNSFNNINFLLNRNTKYNNTGRTQTLKEAIEIDKNLLNIFNNNNIPFDQINNKKAVTKITNKVIQLINKKN